jgi:4-amino-4-deoxy-L-arabinose transferase-like glycosyltransferase
LTIAAIARSPLVDIDEVYIASAALSLVRHGSGVPTVLPAGPWSVPFPTAYGPVFFWLAAGAIRSFGLSTVAVRSVSLAGGLAMAAAAAWLARRAGASRASALCAACLIWLAPEVGRASTNGRMDTVTVAFELAAMALVILPPETSRSRAIGAGCLAGLCAGLAMLTTPRAMTFVAGLAVAAVVALWPARERSSMSAAVLACGIVASFCLIAWPAANGSGPLYYFVTVPAGARIDEFNTVTYGNRDWTLHPVAIGAIAGLVPLAIGSVLAWLRSTRQTPMMRPLLAVLCWACAGAAVYIARVNHTFFREIYFVTPVTAVVLAMAGANVAAGNGRRVLTIACAITALLFGSIRLVKSAQIVESWRGRDPAPLQEFFQAHIPSDAVVVGFNQYYFYAVERLGAHFLASEAEPYGVPFPGSPTIGRPPASALSEIRARFRGRLLIWPEDEHTPLPDAYRCAAGHRLATWTPGPRTTVLDRLPIFKRYAYRLTYPVTSIYQLPPDCPIG